MLTVIAGEDSIKSRDKYIWLKNKYKSEGFNLVETEAKNLPNLANNFYEVSDLFGRKSVYLTENLYDTFKGKKNIKVKEQIQKLSMDKTQVIVDWENGKSAYELSSLKKVATIFEEFKLPNSIFDLLNSCYPKNLAIFIDVLNKVNKNQDIVFIYSLLWRHVRKLVQVHCNTLDTAIAPWQKSKLEFQAMKWDKAQLINFYEKLINIDLSIKTNKSSFDLKESIELLVCYYLR